MRQPFSLPESMSFAMSPRAKPNRFHRRHASAKVLLLCPERQPRPKVAANQDRRDTSLWVPAISASRRLASCIRRHLLNPTMAARNETTTRPPHNPKSIGITSRNASAIEQRMVLSLSLPPRAARPAPCRGAPRALLSLEQQGRQRSNRQVDRPM